MDVLLTWVGDRDPGWTPAGSGRQQFGPILTLLNAHRFDVVHLLFTLDSPVGNFRARATRLLRLCQRSFPAVRMMQHPVDLADVTDYREVYRVTHAVSRRIVDQDGRDANRFYVYLQPGTGQMQTVWVLLVQSGLLPARMVATVRPDLRVPSQPLWHEVDLSLADVPQIVAPDEMTRQLGVLQAQNDNLRAAVRRLEIELAGERAAGSRRPSRADPARIPEGFSLRDHLAAQERLYYARALDQAGGRAAAAARLLSIEPASFRARADALGIRPRRRHQSTSSAASVDSPRAAGREG